VHNNNNNNKIPSKSKKNFWLWGERMVGKTNVFRPLVVRSWRCTIDHNAIWWWGCSRWLVCRFSSPSSSSSSSSSSSLSSSHRPDPFARRPTSKCDPYGQGGLPLTWSEARQLLPTVDAQWKIWKDKDGTDDIAPPPTTTTLGKVDKENSTSHVKFMTATTTTPFALVKDYWHDEYMQGAQFVMQVVSAVAQMNDHFPYQVHLERCLSSSSRDRVWTIRTRVICRTVVLQGLSHHDFFLATMLDVETNRPEVQNLLLSPTTTTMTTTTNNNNS
jgi:hypothetical protein